MSLQKCTSCNEEINPLAKYCSNCGNPVITFAETTIKDIEQQKDDTHKVQHRYNSQSSEILVDSDGVDKTPLYIKNIVRLAGIAGIGIIIYLIVAFIGTLGWTIWNTFIPNTNTSSSYSTSTRSSTRSSSGNEKQLAYTMMMRFVKDKLASPSTAKFPNIFTRDEHTTYIGSNQYRITSYVDSQNGFGAVGRTRFSGVVEEKGTYEWSLISLDLR